MSVIAIRWAYSRPIKNPVAKNVLVFLCTHDFPGNKSVFRIQTICDATSYGRTAVKDSLTFLVDHGFIRKNERFGEDGEQKTNQYELVIDEEYVQEFCYVYNLSTPPGREATPPQSSDDPPPGREATTYKNNALSTKIKKSSCFTRKKSADHEQPQKQKHEPLPEDHFLKSIESKRHNGVKHDFADKMNRQAEVRSTVPEYGPGHPRWELQQEMKRTHQGNKSIN